MVNKSAIEVRGLQVKRGATTVFDGIDVDVARGLITGVMGPSGCGKTTLLRSIVGVQKVRGGSVTVLGEPAGSRDLRRRVSYATQSAAVYDDITVRDNLAYFARILKAPRSDVDRVIETVGLARQAKQLAGDLSGGQHSRVSLGVALLGDPDVIVLDEPTVGLDPLLRAELWETFRAIADSGATLLVSSHVMDEAARCDRLLLLRDGRLLADTTPRALLEETGATDADEAFLALVRRGEAEGSGDADAPRPPRARGHRSTPASRDEQDGVRSTPRDDADPPRTRRERRRS